MYNFVIFVFNASSIKQWFIVASVLFKSYQMREFGSARRAIKSIFTLWPPKKAKQMKSIARETTPCFYMIMQRYSDKCGAKAECETLAFTKVIVEDDDDS